MPKNKKGSIVMDIKIIYKPTDKIVPYENNPRLNDEAVEPVANSIKQFGFKVPIIIDSSNIIVAGHTRFKAAKQLGMDKVPCIVADDLTDEQIKAFRLADNKVAEKATWDMDKLDMELSELNELDFDMSDFGFEALVEADESDDDDFFEENERERTANAYNLDGYDPIRTAGFYQMPIIKAIKDYPSSLLGFNYVLSSKPKAGQGVHFYLDDYQFERIWTEPSRYLDKLSEFDFVLTPDFSLYLDMPMAMKIWNVYRSRLIGQMLQDIGAKVIPTLSWAEADTFSFAFDGIEPGGVVSVSTIGVKRNEEANKIWQAGMNEALKRLKPSCVIVYGGDIGFTFPCKAIYYNNNVLENIKSR